LPEREAAEELYRWIDRDRLEPAQYYAYTVRTVAYLSYPTRSEPTEEMRVKTKPARDFRFLGQIAGKLRFEVAIYDGQSVRRERFRNAVGEEIGGVARRAGTGQLSNFLTGAYLLDLHRTVRLPETSGFRDRIVFLDRNGEVKQRWRDEADPELFRGGEVGRRPEGQPGAMPYAYERPVRPWRR
jgi:hypothetical protein